MPYIDPSSRAYFDDLIVAASKVQFQPGELNYVLTRLAQQYVKQHGTNYTAFNDVLGVLEGVKLELYRRAVAEYENSKIKDNGDVY